MHRGHREHLNPFMAPAAKAFHNQRPQAFAATGFHNPHVNPDERQIAWTPLQCRVSKAITKAVTYRDHARRRPSPHPLPLSLKTATGPATIVSRQPHGYRPGHDHATSRPRPDHQHGGPDHDHDRPRNTSWSFARARDCDAPSLERRPSCATIDQQPGKG